MKREIKTAKQWKLRAKKDRKYRLLITLKNKIIVEYLDLKDKIKYLFYT